MDGLICMMCGEYANDANGPEEDGEGDWWNYCRECDCWTSHPTREAASKVDAAGEKG